MIGEWLKYVCGPRRCLKKMFMIIYNMRRTRIWRHCLFQWTIALLCLLETVPRGPTVSDNLFSWHAVKFPIQRVCMARHDAHPTIPSYLAGRFSYLRPTAAASTHAANDEGCCSLHRALILSLLGVCVGICAYNTHKRCVFFSFSNTTSPSHLIAHITCLRARSRTSRCRFGGEKCPVYRLCILCVALFYYKLWIMEGDAPRKN